MQAEQKIELEKSCECQEFAKLYRLAGIGQVVVMLQQDDELNPEVRFYFDPNIDGFGISSGSVSWCNGAYPVDDRKKTAREFFDTITPSFVEWFIGEFRQGRLR